MGGLWLFFCLTFYSISNIIIIIITRIVVVCAATGIGLVATVAVETYSVAQAAAILATVTGAWIKEGSFIGRGGQGGYNHFHDLLKTIHIWYGSRL